MTLRNEDDDGETDKLDDTLRCTAANEPKLADACGARPSTDVTLSTLPADEALGAPSMAMAPLWHHGTIAPWAPQKNNNTS